ncbi:MAG: MBL fold metallo-hydrolase [Verrucomicrobiota bacterium]|nr:MBL fold metallo-hydrolase [Verrucomicrobiota bacterium]
MKLTDLNPAGGIGANCTLAELGAFRVVIDAGFNPKLSGFACMPDFKRLNGGAVHIVVLTHCHLDHLGAIPVLMRYYPNAWLLMSTATVILYERMLHNSVNIMTRQRADDNIVEYPLYTHREVEALKARVVAMTYDRTRTFEVNGEEIEITMHQSGHVPGAAGVKLVHKKRRYFFTGDVLFAPQRVVGGCRFPTKEPFDVLVTETTRGNTLRTPGMDRARETTRMIQYMEDVLTKKGSILIPAFAFGRMQEILAIIYEARKKRKLPDVPVYASGLGLDLVNYFDEISRKANLLTFRKSIIKEMKVRPLPKRIRPGRLQIPGPAIYVLSSGMVVEQTPSYLMASCLIEDPKNAICFVGYCDPDTPGGRLLKAACGEQVVFEKLDFSGKLACKVERFDLTSHADRDELLAYASEVAPGTVVLTHGEVEARNWFTAALKSALPTTGVLDPVPGTTYSL